MYPWRTGTCAWMTMLLVEGILGARRHYDGLLDFPLPPKALPHARLTRTYRERSSTLPSTTPLAAEPARYKSS